MNIAKVVLVMVLSITCAAATGAAQDFTFVTDAENIVSSKAVLGMPGLTGNPRAIIVVTPSEETQRLNPHPIGAWFYNGKWNIFNTDHAAMAPGLAYKLEIYQQPGPRQFVHVVTRDNLSENSSYIDSPALNNNPKASLKILQNYAPDYRAYNLNQNHAEARYNGASGKWYITNVNGKSLYPNTAYNVVVGGGKVPSIRPSSITTTTREPISVPVKAPVRMREAVTSSPSEPLINSSSSCTNSMAQETIGTWGRQKVDDLAMADRTFPKAQYKSVLAKAQEVIELFKVANPEFKGIEAHAYRGIRGDSIIPNGPVPFRVDVRYGSYICVGNDTASVDMRGRIIVHGNYGVTTVSFNSLSDVLERAQDGRGLRTIDGAEILQYNKDLGEFRAWTLIQTSHRDSYHEAVILKQNDRLPYKPVTREQYVRARIKQYESGTGMRDAITGLNRVLENMSPSERQMPALVRDVTTLPGGSRLFASEAEGGRHLVTIDKSYFNPKLPRDKIQLITVHWHSSPSDRPKLEMLEAFKKNFDFLSLQEMIGN